MAGIAGQQKFSVKYTGGVSMDRVVQVVVVGSCNIDLIAYTGAANAVWAGWPLPRR
jgi:hypothetical protein